MRTFYDEHILETEGGSAVTVDFGKRDVAALTEWMWDGTTWRAKAHHSAMVTLSPNAILRLMSLYVERLEAKSK